ncbi:MAG TPA: LytTR family DNA-binding domain-containing protein [Chitinophagaceae bacterium]|nr:LytTR family DNA-binding domain-containing protein [Chitinophagaceae bacterium]
MIKAIIVDDELAAGEVICNLIQTFTTAIEVCSICHTIDHAIQEIQRIRPDILFLDIELAEGSGFEILERLPDLRLKVVFVTAYEQYALKAIKHHAFDYILKPVVPAEFKELLDKLLRQEETGSVDSSTLLRFLQEQRPKRIAVPMRSGFHYYDVQDIIMLKAQGSYTSMCLTGNREVLVTRILKDFETSLAGNGFLRVHKSFMVNTRYIVELRKEDSGHLLMSNGELVPISTKDRESILNSLQAAVRII